MTPISALVRSAVALAAAFSALPAGAPLGAQPNPAGPDVQVNEYTTSTQTSPDVAADAEGGFVVVWQSLGSPGPDASGTSIQGRRFSSDGTPLGTQFEINGEFSTGDQVAPRVARAPGGQFVVVWIEPPSEPQDVVQARRFDADGTPLGAPFVVAPATSDNLSSPAVGMDAAGRFVVAWSRIVGTPPAATGSIQARRYAANGSPEGAAFQVNSFSTATQVDTAIGVAPDGAFAIAWSSDGSPENDDDGLSIQLRAFQPNGTPRGEQHQVNALTLGSQSEPEVSMAPDGRFVVAWESFESSGTDAYLSVEARRYTAPGVPEGGQFQVNMYTPGDQGYPDVAMGPDGTFVVAWESYGSPGPDSSSQSIQARRFHADGSPDGDQLQVNTVTTSGQMIPRIASSELGNLALVWLSQSSAGTDQDGSSIQSRRLDALFRDGFATGDTTRWSHVEP